MHLNSGFTCPVCEYMHFRNKQVRRNTFFETKNPFKPLLYRYEEVPLFYFAGILSALSFLVKTQHIYAPDSVLSSGNWYKLNVNETGIYKIDISFLNGLGITMNNLASISVRLYGNGCKMPGEVNMERHIDDLKKMP